MQTQTKIRIACYSDLHGTIPEPVDCDLAIVAGDICGDAQPLKQFVFLTELFQPWLKKFPNALWVAGNHDFVCETQSWLCHSFGNAYYLENERYSFTNGLKVWGTPYSLPYFNYAFMKDEEGIAQQLSNPHAQRADIIISHGPPYGYGDAVPRVSQSGDVVVSKWDNTGSWALRQFIHDHNPALVVTGHIHWGYGVYHCGETTIVNAALPTPTWENRPPIMVDMEKNDGKWKVIHDIY